MTILTTHEQVPQISRPGPMGPSQAAFNQQGISGKEVLQAIRRRKWMIIISVLTMIVVTGVGTFLWGMYAPLYVAEAYLGVNAPKASALVAVSEQSPREVMDRLVSLHSRMVRTEPVLGEALKMDQITKTNWFNQNKASAYQRLFKSIKANNVSSEGLICISMMGTDAGELSNIVNAVARAAVIDSQVSSSGAYIEQINNLRDESRRIEAELTDIRNKKTALRPKDIALIEENRNSLTLKLQQLQGAINAFEIKKSEFDRAIEGLEKEDMTQNPDVLQMLDMDPTLRSLRVGKVSLETERDNMVRKFGPKHRSVQDLQARLVSVNDQLTLTERNLMERAIPAVRHRSETEREKITRILLDLNLELQATQAGSKGLEETVAKIRALDDEEKRKTAQLHKIKDKELDLGLLRPTENPIYPRRWATTPKEPKWPDWWVTMPVGIVLGLIIGFGLALTLEFIDTSVKSPSDVARRVDLPVLGMIPHTDDLEEEIEDLRLAFKTNPSSLVGESFRQIRTCLLFSGPANQRRSMLVTSATPEDGRTTVALNLAASMARGGRKVLVVDANFRQPAIRQLFPQCKDAGLSNALVGQAAWRDLTCEIEPNLTVMSSGPLPPNPAELLGSEDMRQLIGEMTAEFDQVIFDGAPTLVVSDSTVLATVVDGVILVVRAGSNTYGIVQRTRDILQRVGSRILGVTLNGVRATAGGYLRKSYQTFYDYHSSAQLPGDKND